jgi:hypothetical protein
MSTPTPQEQRCRATCGNATVTRPTHLTRRLRLRARRTSSRKRRSHRYEWISSCAQSCPSVNWLSMGRDLRGEKGPQGVRSMWVCPSRDPFMEERRALRGGHRADVSRVHRLVHEGGLVANASARVGPRQRQRDGATRRCISLDRRRGLCAFKAPVNVWSVRDAGRDVARRVCAGCFIGPVDVGAHVRAAAAHAACDPQTPHVLARGCRCGLAPKDSRRGAGSRPARPAPSTCPATASASASCGERAGPNSRLQLVPSPAWTPCASSCAGLVGTGATVSKTTSSPFRSRGLPGKSDATSTAPRRSH